MPQDPLGATVAVSSTGQQAALRLAASGSLRQCKGTTTKLNMTAANAIKATPGRLTRVIIIAPGSGSGTFTFNDCATTGAAAAANAIFVLPYNGSNNIAGQTFDLDIPCAVGIVLSAVPGAGSPIIACVYE